MFAALTFPAFDPVALQIGPFALRWYALAYIAGIVLAWRYCRWLAKRPPAALSPDAFDDFLLWGTLGVVLGGRLGYVLFYKPSYYLANPLEILMLWQGGMSFHGGLLGVVVAIGLFARQRKVSYFTVSDILACATPIGLGLGRIANFINGELYGRTADPDVFPWAMIFPGGGPLPRHPSQLYEALLEGLVLFLALFVLMRRGALLKTGYLTGAFMIGYALARIFVEFFREPDLHLGFILPGVSMGQILTLPMLLIGIAAVLWARQRS